jgi:hypothetical protein
MRRLLAVALALLVSIGALAFWRYTPADWPPSETGFSIDHARELQRALVESGPTRTVGSEGNARARARIIAELSNAGYTVDTQEAFVCARYGTCATVANVIGVLRGRSSDSLLLSAHYDSVPASPGASDDGLGAAAVLEAARTLGRGPFARTVLVVLTDGEESGLLGAEAFVHRHPLAKTVRATINVDSRGARGPSQMFETGPGNAKVIGLVASHLERPVTTSLFYEVYKRLPNDTDFTLTKTLAPGVNFANTAGIEHYHTGRDDLEASSPATLKHHGEHVVGMARVFLDADLASTRNDIWFDVLAFFVIRFPERAVLPFAIAAFVLLVGHAVRFRAFDRGLLAFLLPVGVGIACAAGAGAALRASGAIVALWNASPDAALVSIQGAALAGFLLTASVLRAKPTSTWSGVWLTWAVLGVVTTVIAPGTSYLFVVPAVVAAIAGALPFAVAVLLPLVAAAALSFEIATALYDGLGFTAPALLALPTMLLAAPLAPMTNGTRGARVLAILLLVTSAAHAVLAMQAPKFTPDHPQRVNVVFKQDEAGARVFVDTAWGATTWGAAPARMTAAIGAKDHAPPMPWEPPAAYAQVPPIDAPAPTAEVIETREEGGRRIIRARLVSARGASSIVLLAPRGHGLRVRVDDQPAFFRAVPKGAMLVLAGLSKEAARAGLVVQLEMDGAGPLAVTLLDRSPGVPSAAEPVVRARGAEGTPYQDGDITVRSTSLSL